MLRINIDMCYKWQLCHNTISNLWQIEYYSIHKNMFFFGEHEGCLKIVASN